VVGQPIGVAFEAYEMGLDPEGGHRARLRVSVARRASGGWVRVLLRLGRGQPEAELGFDVSGTGSTLEQLLDLRVPPLEPGSYVLRVEVHDLVTGSRGERSAPFTVLEPGRRS
jgi:hypothetical protein